MSSIFIGIDGGKDTGFAVWNKSTKSLVEVKTLDFWKAINEVDNYLKLYPTLVLIIEDVSQHSAVFKAMGTYRSTPGGINNKIGAVAKHGQNIGRVKRETELFIRYFELKKVDVRKIKPGKHTGSKIKKDLFKKITGFDKVTSQHGRDAAMLIYGL